MCVIRKEILSITAPPLANMWIRGALASVFCTLPAVCTVVWIWDHSTRLHREFSFLLNVLCTICSTVFCWFFWVQTLSQSPKSNALVLGNASTSAPLFFFFWSPSKASSHHFSVLCLMRLAHTVCFLPFQMSHVMETNPSSAKWRS